MSYARSFASVLSLAGALWSAPAVAASCPASNLVIVIDRSCSMTSNSINGKTRWDIAVDAIKAMTTKYAGKLQYGLVLFPDKGISETSKTCVQTMPMLSPEPNNEQKVLTLLANNRPNSPCITNIDEGIKQARDNPVLYGTDRRTFVLLITDGAQSGGCNGGRAGADPLTNQYLKEMYDKKVPTYVVGFDVGTNTGAQTSLNGFALSGGLPNPGTPSFIPANNQAELDAALDKIASSSTSGEFSVCKGQPCPDNRCLTAGATCVSGFCVEPAGDGGTGSEADLGDPLNGGTVATGCSCRLGEQPGELPLAPAVAAVAALGGMLLARRRRSARG
ncbi:MAG: vWA domain-containing protein [Polyangia bacterium]